MHDDQTDPAADPDAVTDTAGWVRGRRLAVDVGSVRIGVASCDPDGLLATPVETVSRSKKDHPGASDVRRLAALVDEYEAIEVIVGLPRTLRGTEGRATGVVRSFARVLAEAIDPVPVIFADERFSTVTAQQSLHSSGVDTRRGRSVIDQAAAVAILQSWMERRKAAAAREAGERETSGPGAPDDEPARIRDDGHRNDRRGARQDGSSRARTEQDGPAHGERDDVEDRE